MRHVFIINPAAGKGRQTRQWAEKVHAFCKDRELDYALYFTESPGDGVRLTAGVVAQGEETRIYACGGDGTLGEVVQAAAGVDHIAITNVPLGTGNDFLKMFGKDYRAKFTDLAALAEGPQSPCDLIDCNGRLGLDIICAGVDARVAKDVHMYDAIPGVSGIGAYILSLGVNVFKGLTREMEVEMDGKKWAEPITLLCVCNGRYYGGGFMPVADALPDDGVLDVLLVPKVKKLDVVRLVGDYAKGKYKDHPDYIKDYHGAGPITVRAKDPITLVVDGEVMEDRAYTIRLSEKKVNFFYPAGATWHPAGQTAKELAGVIGE